MADQCRSCGNFVPYANGGICPKCEAEEKARQRLLDEERIRTRSLIESEETKQDLLRQQVELINESNVRVVEETEEERTTRCINGQPGQKW